MRKAALFASAAFWSSYIRFLLWSGTQPSAGSKLAAAVEAAREHLQKSGIQVKEGSIPPDSSLEAARKCYLKDGPTKLQKALTVMLEEKVEAEPVRKQTPEDDVRMASSCAKESARVFSTCPTTASSTPS